MLTIKLSDQAHNLLKSALNLSDVIWMKQTAAREEFMTLLAVVREQA
jgi:hypothetical protein